MASSHKTEHYGLSQFAPLDRPAWLVDYNTDMEKIDDALHTIAESGGGGGGGTLDQTARDMAEAAQNAAKDAQEMATAAQATADEALEKAEEALNQQGTITGDITNINEEITQIKNDVNTAQSTATTANETAEEALTLAQGCVKRSGDTMTGVLKLAGNPVDDADAANKGYVDSVAGNPFPDVPFTDDRWKFAGEVDTTAKKIQFTRLPREFLFVVSVEPSQQGIAQINLQTEAAGLDSNFSLCSLTDSPITEIAVQLPVVLTGHIQNRFSLKIPGQNTLDAIYIEDDFSSMVNVLGKTGTGSIKIYWR